MPSRNISRTQRPRARTMPAQRIPIASEPTYEQIRQRAYEIYCGRGATPGNPDDDWRQAEHEMRGRLTLLGRT